MVNKILSERGYKPMYIVYRVKHSDLEKIAENILFEKFNFKFKAKIKHPTSEYVDERAFAISLSLDENHSDWTEEKEEEMMNCGCNPYDANDVRDFILFELAGKSDCYAEVSFGSNNEKYIDVFLPIETGLKQKLLDILNITMSGSREDTIIALNDLIKEMRY